MEEELCLLPLVGMEWKGRSIRFGDSREAVESILSAPETVRGSRCYYFQNELALDFDSEGRLEFVECLGGVDGGVQPWIYGVPAFRIDAEELIDLLKQHNGDDVDDSEAGYSYAFRTSAVGVYREITPADVEEMIREMVRMDLTAMGEVNLEEEKRRAHHWLTIGIGRENYYR